MFPSKSNRVAPPAPLLALTLGILLSSCPGWDGQSYSYSYSYSDAEPGLDLDFGQEDSITVHLSNLGERGVYLVSYNDSDTAILVSDSGDISASTRQGLGQGLGTTPGTRASSTLGKRIGRPIPREYPPARDALRDLPPRPQAPKAGTRAVADYPYGQNDRYALGAERVFNVLGIQTTCPAQLRAIGDHCYVWVAKDNYLEGSGPSNDQMLNDAQALALRDYFEGSQADGSDGIFVNETSLLGYEYGGGKDGDGGRDGDQHISIFIYDIEGDYEENQESGVLGYFYANDYFETEGSNECEMFYLDAHFTDAYPSLAVSVLIHEYQHMIQFNRLYIQAKKNNIPTWYNEMCSMLAEDCILDRLGLDSSNAEYAPVFRLGAFAYHYAESGPCDWISQYPLMSYASSYAFGAFLLRNYGGPALLKAMLDSGTSDKDAINAAITSLGIESDFDSALWAYGQALVYDSPPQGSGFSSFYTSASSSIPISESLESLEYELKPILLSGYEQFDVQAYATVVDEANNPLMGLRIYDIGDKVDMRPYGYLVQTSPDWLQKDSLDISLSRPENAHIKLRLLCK